MKRLSWALLALAASAALLAACGGGGGGGGSSKGGDGTGSEVPSSAQQSIEGLVAYLNNLIDTRTDETSEPVVLGDAVLPTSEGREPL